MPSVVIDASATLAWLFGEEDPNGWLADNLVSATLLAPVLWRLEVVNAIVVKERRKQITEVQGDRFLEILDGLPIAMIPPDVTQSLRQLARLARMHQLTSYDATYLDSAHKTAAALLTLDGNLQNAARRNGVSLIE